MANAEQKQQGDGGRFVGTTWQDLLDLETVDVPEYLRIQNNPDMGCLLYTSPSPRDSNLSRMPSSA